MLNREQNKYLENLLSHMTLEEKIGQLRQIGPSLAGAFEVDFEELLNMLCDGRLSKDKFNEILASAQQDYHEDELREGKIGSYNGIGDMEKMLELQRIAVEETRLGIPLLFCYDVVHGYRTVTPIPLAESCAWDPDLWKRTARISAKEATADGIKMTFAPMVDVSKDARWGRISEGAGEDTLLNSIYGAAKVRGFQSNKLSDTDAMAACVKHFAAYGAVESGKDYNRVDISEQRLYEEYLPSFKSCIDAGVKAVMPAFNDINGIPCTSSKKLLRKILREDWEFEGMTISDANAIAELVQHGIACDKTDAARLAITSGVDMDMTSEVYYEKLKINVKNGQVTVEELNRAVMNVLKVKMELGLFDDPYQTSFERSKEAFLTEEYRKIAREAAGKSIVLLKNEGVLPISKDFHIGIVGSLAKDRSEMTGTWALKAVVDDCISIVDACEARNINYTYFEDERNILEFDGDVFIAVVGERKNESGEAASKVNLELPKEQLELLEKLKETGKPVVVILCNGRPLAIPWIAEQMPAILEAWHLGVEAGNAILDILVGEVNPSAKLTTTFPRATGQCPIYYNHPNTGRPAGKSKFTSKYIDVPEGPVFEFGYGISYTTYEYKDLSVDWDGYCIHISVNVANTGDRSGQEIVECYIQDPVAECVRPIRKLVDFMKVFLEPGEEKKIQFMIEKEKLGYFDSEMKFRVDPGEIIVFVGGTMRTCLQESVQIS